MAVNYNKIDKLGNIWLAQRRVEQKLGFESIGDFGNVAFYKTKWNREKVGKFLSTKSDDKAHAVWLLLTHPNILRPEKLITMPDIGYRCYLMPREFSTLDDIVKNDWFKSDPYNIFDLKRWILDVLSGIDYLHKNGLCHLNVLSSNVLISFDSKAKLGGMTSFRPSTEPVNRCGLEYPYLPPELCHTRGNSILVDGIGCDMWSVGMMILRLFTKDAMVGVFGTKPTVWSKYIYREIFEEIKELGYLGYHAWTLFPETGISFLDRKRLKNFLRMLLSLNPDERPSAKLAKQHRFLCLGLFMPKSDAVWKKKASPSTIEMIVEKNNTAEIVRKRCEGRVKLDLAKLRKEYYTSLKYSDMRAERRGGVSYQISDLTSPGNLRKAISDTVLFVKKPPISEKCPIQVNKNGINISVKTAFVQPVENKVGSNLSVKQPLAEGDCNPSTNTENVKESGDRFVELSRRDDKNKKHGLICRAKAWLSKKIRFCRKNKIEK